MPSGEVDLPPNTELWEDGTIRLPDDGRGTVTIDDGGPTIDVPGGAVIDGEGKIWLLGDENGIITTDDGTMIAVPKGTFIDSDGTAIVGDAVGIVATTDGTTVDVPGGTVIEPDGTAKLPDDEGGTVTTTDGTTLEVPPSTVIQTDGTIRMPTGGFATVKTSDEIVNVRVYGGMKAESDGSITVTNNVEVRFGEGYLINLSNGKIVEGTSFSSITSSSPLYLFVIVGSGTASITYPDGKSQPLTQGEVIRVDREGNIEFQEKGSTAGGSSSGCNAGFGVFALALAGAVALRKRAA